MKIQNINFKKAFATLFVTFLIFAAISVGYVASSNQWSEAVGFQREILESESSVTYNEVNWFTTTREFLSEVEHSGTVGERDWLAVTNEFLDTNEFIATQVAASNSFSTLTADGSNPVNYLFRNLIRANAFVTSDMISSLSNGFIAIYATFYLFLFAFRVMITMWVYKDAKSRGKNLALWTVLTFVGNIPGLILYLIVGEVNKKQEPSLVSA